MAHLGRVPSVSEDLTKLPKGTRIRVLVDGYPRDDVVIIAAEGVFEAPMDFKGPLIPGYWCSTAAGFASVRAKNILEVLSLPEVQGG